MAVVGDGAVQSVNQRQPGADGVRQVPGSHRSVPSPIRLDDELRWREAVEEDAAVGLGENAGTFVGSMEDCSGGASEPL